MRMGVKMNLFAACLAAVLMAANANAAVIYFDDFSGSSETGLNGTAPDTRPGTTETWLSSTLWRADGSKPSGGSGAYLPFVPATGQIYTLSADMNATNTDSNWLALGFAGATDTSAFVNTTPYAWIMMRGDRTQNDSIQTFPALTQSTGQHSSPSGVVNLKVVLDTSTPLWSVQWFADNGLLRAYNYSANPAISHVGFGSHSGGMGTVDNFTLSVVPEPAGLSLLALGGVMLLRRWH